jgi:arginase
MQVDIFRVPYDSGHLRQRMGRGPDRLIESGIVGHIKSRGHTARVTDIILEPGFTTEVTGSAELARRLSHAVGEARSTQRFPLVLAGNCNTSLGTVAGMGGDIGVIWFDAHGDFNTPETTPTGFFDGQALAALSGRCWSALTATIPGFSPVDDRSIVLAGARDLDERELDLLLLSCVTRVDASLASLADAVLSLARRVDGVYLHIDLDVLDRDEIVVNRYSVPNGLSVSQLIDAVELIGATVPILAAAFTAYDPDYDPSGAVCAVAQQLVETILSAAHTA